MDSVESLIALYLTRGGAVFVVPQFNLAWNELERDGGSCPDFVALDFHERRVIVVEVTSSYALDGLFERIKNRDAGWFKPILRHLHSIQAITSEWNKPRFLGFVRNDRFKTAQAAFDGDQDVTFCRIEDAMMEYSYSAARKLGLP